MMVRDVEEEEENGVGRRKYRFIKYGGGCLTGEPTRKALSF